MESVNSRSRVLRAIIFSFFLAVIAGISGVAGVISVVVYQVYWGDHSSLKKSTILARINEESSIYARDGKTRIGSFFNEAHRTYIPIDRVPAHMVRAMVASEDQNFYEHVGVDPLAIGSAFWEGVSNGFRFRRGGSSITQQTVKNIMDRREHSFRRKFKEMIRALQLERLYSKNEILEFYLNQFHVTANGNGIGIAAKYYFSKAVEDLNLVEAAFIAGSVKAPNKYNPFTKYTKQAKAKAWKRANERKNYVLRRMYEQGWIEKDELVEAWDIEVPFKKGKFTSREVALVSLIRGQLNKPEILETLNLDTVDELNQAGLRVHTTIDSALQKEGQLAMRRNLSRLEFILEGFRVEDPEKFKALRSLEEDQFAFGKIAHIEKGKTGFIEVDYGLPVGRIELESLIRTAKILNLPTYKGHEFHLKEIFDTLKVGDVILTEIKSYDRDSHRAQAELKAYPKINGGLIAVDEGEVRAVVSGFDAQGFNRAMFATRQPGSVFKSVVYLAALQLGWTVLDQLDNERRVFPFQGNLYYPRPDHASPYSNVSMIWAGTKSENIASIYLAAHLLDKLNFGEFKKLMGHMGLMPIKGESVSEYHYRVSKTVGVQLNSDGIREHLLISAIHDLRPDLVFSGHGKLYRQLAKLWWGRGYLAELKNLYALDEEEVKPEERNQRVEMMFFNYERMNRLATELAKDWEYISQKVAASGGESLYAESESRSIVEHFRVLNGSSGSPILAYARTLPEEEEFIASELKDQPITKTVPGRALNALDVQLIWGQSGAFGQANIQIDDVYLDGVIPRRFLSRIESNLNMRVDTVMSAKDLYGLYRYFNHHDFRVALGLNYLVDLSRAMGVYSDLEPVLSFPLGTNVVAVAEVAKIYQTFVSGKTYKFYKEGPKNQLNFIARIEDRDGNILYEPKKEEFQLFEPCLADQMSEILGKVVTHGTGRRARGELQIPLREADPEKKVAEVKVRVPVFGKTGTTNDYTTAYFAGYIPYPKVHRAPLDIKNSYVVASYVGYDMNRTMKRGPFKVSGAYGALPVWSDFGKSLLDEMEYAKYMDNLDLSLYKSRVWPLAREPKCGNQVRVDLPRGILVGAAGLVDPEVYDYTNIEAEGEEVINEFARNASVRSLVHLKVRGGQPQGQLSLFQKLDAEQQAEQETIETSQALDDNVAGGGVQSNQVPAGEREPGLVRNLPQVLGGGTMEEKELPQVEDPEAAQLNNETSVYVPQTQPAEKDPEEAPQSSEEEDSFSEEDLW